MSAEDPTRIKSVTENYSSVSNETDDKLVHSGDNDDNGNDDDDNDNDDNDDVDNDGNDNDANDDDDNNDNGNVNIDDDDNNNATAWVLSWAFVWTFWSLCSSFLD